MNDAISIILANSGLVALRHLLAIRRAEHSKFSYSSISRKLGIKSRSYLAEAIKGKKKLNEKHIDPIVSSLNLPEAAAELLKNKLYLESADLNSTEREKLRIAIQDASKKFSSSQIELNDVRDINLVMKMAMCLYIFPRGRATRRDIIELFGQERFVEVEWAIMDLLRNGLLVKEGDYFRYADNVSEIFHLYTRTSPSHEKAYLKSALQEASEHLDELNRRPESCVFYSGLITAQQLAYLQSMDFIKQSLRNIQSRIEAKDADSLVRFNVQIYPILVKS